MSAASRSEDGPYTLSLDTDGYGTLLGALAWVLGALEIMRDRGHAEDDESFHELSSDLEPRLNRLLADLAGAGSAAEPTEAQAGEVDAAYARVRAAFEAWIQLTAVDTAAVAIEQRLGELEQLAEQPAQPPDERADVPPS